MASSESNAQLSESKDASRSNDIGCTTGADIPLGCGGLVAVLAHLAAPIEEDEVEEEEEEEEEEEDEVEEEAFAAVGEEDDDDDDDDADDDDDKSLVSAKRLAGSNRCGERVPSLVPV
jgi:phosphopantothenoylcysteine synthetase/decarboxylase